MLPVYVCLGQRDVEREVELVDRWRLRSPNLFIRPFDMQDETRAGKKVEWSTSAIFWMWNSRESKNSKFKPVILFVKEEGQNIFNSLLALFTTFKYSDIQ